jgi:hypothetical protein
MTLSLANVILLGTLSIFDGIEVYLDIFGICSFLEIMDGLVLKSNLAGSTRWAQPPIPP